MKTKKILKCADCGNVVEVLSCSGCADISCCGKPMSALDEKTADSSKEKHVPVASKNNAGGTKVSVGSVPHPMTPEHHIEWIEIVNGPYVNRFYLKADGAPEADFYLAVKPGMILREYCNIHGLWSHTV